MKPFDLYRRPGRSLMRGQSMIEYLVLAAIALALLAVPIDGYSSVVAEMLDVIKTAYAKFLAAISIPQ